jgi:sugar transferase EpsL
VKAIFDRSSAFLALVVLSPLIAIVAVLVRLLLGKPILFRQQRPGLHARLFTLYKFRTMREFTPEGAGLAPVDARDAVLTDAVRLTTLGRILRRVSLDEFPQLFNILKGDMSLVGPRPLLVEYLPLYTPEQARRHEVRPGLTGWAQVNGRNAVTWEEKLALDVWYVDNHTLWLDLRIVVRTVGQTVSAIFRANGISQEGQATVVPFTGTAGAQTEVGAMPPADAAPAGREQ